MLALKPVIVLVVKVVNAEYLVDVVVDVEDEVVLALKPVVVLVVKVVSLQYVPLVKRLNK